MLLRFLPDTPENELPKMKSTTSKFRRTDAPDIPGSTVLGDRYPSIKIQIKNVKDLKRRDVQQIVTTIKTA